MLQHLLISTVSLFVMIAGWYSLQRLMQQGRAIQGIDFLKGRWGCGDCSCMEACDPEEKTGEALKTVFGASRPLRNPGNTLPG